MLEKNNYLIIHGHFYQPPRENPWLESIELQDSAAPFHDWNARIAYECYNPNSVSRIVDHNNKILDIVNNYSLMSFNIGPTLLSWLETQVPNTYERIIEADRQSMEEHYEHGNALAQVYNHIIMPLANERDKYTQVIWGIKDFQYRFGRNPEGMWLSETATDDDTLRVLVDCGIKFTILSPYQVLRVRRIGSNDQSWSDVSWGSIDPGQAYRYFLKDGTDRYIDLFFYDGSISKAVAFESLLYNGDQFISKLKGGISSSREYNNQLIHIATDGESYGHHTKFGDMALSYVLKRRAPEVGFKLTNYGEFLANNPPVYEADIKQRSSWSCSHGVGRWEDNCGCSTGAKPGWNQKWRKPLRMALDWLRDELVTIYEKNAGMYLKDPWKTRNRYIEIILDRSEQSVKNFLVHESPKKLSESEINDVMNLLEMQRQAMLMYTSCGWFFADISGIETVQILKYAARAMQIAGDFSETNLEGKFLDILSEAKSNIAELGSGKDIYLRFVKPSIISIKQVVSHWAISSLFEEYEGETDIYCYNLKNFDYRKFKKGNTSLVFGHIEISSKITLEKHNMMLALLHYGGEDFHCVIKNFTTVDDYNKIKETLAEKYHTSPLTEVIRSLDDYFGREYFTLKDLFLEERRKIISILIKDQLDRFATTYQDLYLEGKGPMLQLNELGLKVPSEFKIAAEYSLSRSFNDIISNVDDIANQELIQEAIEINREAKLLGVKLNLEPAEKIYSVHLTDMVKDLAINMEIKKCENTINTLSLAQKLGLRLNLSHAQDVFFNSIYNQVLELFETIERSKNQEMDQKFISSVLSLGTMLNFNVEKRYIELNKLSHVEIKH